MPAPLDPLVVRFVPGVTPAKWERTWRDRMRVPLRLEPSSQEDAIAALRSGAAHLALLRDASRSDDFHAIPLYRERPVVVVPRESLLAEFEELTLADIADEPRHEGEDAAAVELVAANVGVAVMPMSIARLHSRKDVVARPLTDAPDTGISLVWPIEEPHPLADTFIGIVRGRTANSSR
jgi:DNA-binding transcriptional LysR family regulator